MKINYSNISIKTIIKEAKSLLILNSVNIRINPYCKNFLSHLFLISKTMAIIFSLLR